MILGKRQGAAQDKDLIDEFPLNLDVAPTDTKTKSARKSYLQTGILFGLSISIIAVFGSIIMSQHQIAELKADPTYADNKVILRLARSYIQDGDQNWLLLCSAQ